MIKRIFGIFLVLCILVASSSFAGVENDVTGYEIEIFTRESIDLDEALNVNDIALKAEEINWELSSAHYGVLENNTFTSKRSGELIIYGYYGEQGDDVIIFSIDIRSPLNSFEFLNDSISLKLGYEEQVRYKAGYVLGFESDQLKDVVFESSDPTVFSVDKNGFITPKSVGKGVLKAFNEEGIKLDMINVVVETDIKDISIEDDDIKTDVYSGESKALELQYLATVAKPEVDIIWSSDDKDIVTVSSSGVIEGHGTGSALVWANVSGTKISDFIRVNVNNLISDVILSDRSVILNDAESEFQLLASLIPKYEDKPILNETLNWESTNTSVVTVNSNGLLQAVGSGRARVIVKSQDGNRFDECEVYVQLLGDDSGPEIEDMSISGLPFITYVGKRYEIDFEYYPSNASLENLLTTASNGGSDQIEFFEGKYYFVPKNEGKTSIEFKVAGGPHVKDIVDVRSYLLRVEIKEDSLPVLKEGIPSLYLGQKIDVMYELFKKYSYRNEALLYKGVTWSEDEPKVATIDPKTGRLNALKAGTCTIKVVTDDSRKTDELEIQVIPMVYDIELPKEHTFLVNEVYKPEVDYELPYGYEAPFVKDFRIDVNDMYLTTEYIENEMQYEENVISTLNSLGDTNAVEVEKTRHEVRLKVLKSIYKTNQGDYCRYHGNLKDRQGENLEVYQIEGVWIKGLIPSRLEIEVISVDGSKKDTMKLYINK